MTTETIKLISTVESLPIDIKTALIEKLLNSLHPSYEPTLCTVCGKVIVLGEDGYAQLGDKYWCEVCYRKKRKMKSVERINQPDAD
jgi:hypothetical protein